MGFRKITARFAGLAAAVLLAAGTLVGCVNASDVKAEEPASVSSAAPATKASTTSAGTTTGSSAGATSAASTAAGTNTELTSGQVSVTIDGKSTTLSGAYVVDGIDAVIDGGTYSSTTADQAVFLVVNGGSLTIRNAGITKSGDTSNEEQSNFYGFNSAVLVAGEGSSVTVENTTITTQSSGSNGVVATGGATATHANSSRGLHATYQGAIPGENVATHTRGAHSATLATDRGNGTVAVTGTNDLNTEGDGSPLLYSTGQISASGVTGEAKDSEVVVVEGKNSATLTDSTVTSNGKKAVMLYQSFSGDAHDKDATATRSTFTMTNTKLTANGTDAVLYATNTTTSATLTNVEITSSTSVGVKADEDRWGKSGSNGATLHLVLDGTTITGGATAGSSSAITIASANGGTVEGEVSGSVTNS